MSRQPFNAYTWLRPKRAPYISKGDGLRAPSPLSTKAPPNKFVGEFDPSNFLTQGWTGDGLIGKGSRTLHSMIRNLEEDVKSQFGRQTNFNKSLIISIFTEFLSFAESQAISCNQLDDYKVFWQHLFQSNSEYRALLDRFIDIYCIRVATIYLFKIRFFTILCKHCGYKIYTKDLLNPNSFFIRTFKKASSLELKSDSLGSNQYTWYRPSPDLYQKIEQLSKVLPKLSISEMLKAFSNKVEELKALEEDETHNYSHSLSHVQFGRFLHTLLVKIPYWLRGNSINQSTNENNTFPDILSCKYSGDHLTSLSLAHWQAQEGSLSKRWNHILCPEFSGKHFSTGPFMKICFELQFMTFLANMAEKQGYHPITFISRTFNEKSRLQQKNIEKQISLFEQDTTVNKRVHSRVVLNLSTFPKNNPHFFLLSQINTAYEQVANNGYLYVFTDKKLFVPSQSEKVEQLLNKLKIEFSLSLDSLKGKGELPSFVYIFSKSSKASPPNENALFNFQNTSKNAGYAHGKHPCFSLRLNGNLRTFHQFSSVVNSINEFIKLKKADATTFYQKEFEDNFTLEFYQDAIVEGKLINSTKDSTKITHPSFFKNLLKSCVTLEEFFTIENINIDYQKKQKSLTSSLIGIPRIEDQYSYLLIVDFRNSNQTKIEITTIEAYRGKLQEYGFALCRYFGLLPKRLDINLNLFREFFNSTIGLQIIQFALTGKINKLKSKLNSILVPKFFTSPFEIPNQSLEPISYLHLQSEQMRKLHPSDLIQKIQSTRDDLLKLGPEFPWHTLSMLSSFKFNLVQVIERVDSPTVGNDHSIFTGPIVQEAILSLPRNVLFPDNKDIYIQFNKAGDEIHSPLTSSHISSEETESNSTSCLQLKSNNQIIVSLYSRTILLNFIEFLLTNAQNVPISTLLQCLKVPSIQDLENCVNNIDNLLHSYQQTLLTTNSMIETILREQVCPRS